MTISEQGVYIVGIGLVSPAATGREATWEAAKRGERAIGELTLFPDPPQGALPVAEVGKVEGDEALPRTHRLALVAATEALEQAGLDAPPDAVVLGGTTGGIPTTELLLREGVEDPAAYRWHGAGTVADLVAEQIGCSGPALTVATACSSGAVALKVALEMLRRGDATTVLAGGVDALCRLTYHGFAILKVIDPEGARPLDEAREGMTVGEGAAMLVLTRAATPPEGAVARLAGGGLSCDAYHASSPHPEGVGALAAMRAALDDAGVSQGDLGHVHLHGTGTKDNDASEARALRALFGDVPLPPHASIKGSFGHAVGAAGAFGAAFSALALRDRFVPGNVGCTTPDPALGLEPTPSPMAVSDLDWVLADSFGFGGNNAALVLGRPGIARPTRSVAGEHPERFAVVAASCVTGVGRSEVSSRRLDEGEPLAGVLAAPDLVAGLPKRRIRRIRRLPRIALALAADLGREGEPPEGVHGLFMGTAWGALTETESFLRRLFESNETSSSPTEFVGTVHNAVTGQVAMWLGATGPNVTATTGSRSFVDALMLATLLGPAVSGRILVMGADEAQEVLTPRLDPPLDGTPVADGGGALLLEPAEPDEGRVTLRLVRTSRQASMDDVDGLVEDLGGADVARERFGAVWTWGSLADRELADRQLERLSPALGDDVAHLDIGAVVGRYATTSAAATALAARALLQGSPLVPPDRGILVLGLGQDLSAIELLPAR